MKINIPFQKMTADVPVQVIRLADLHSDASLLPHRHNFYMLLWATKGKGAHRINYRDFELIPDRLFFTHEGHIHQMLSYPEDGWVALFQPLVFREFLNLYKRQEQAGLFDYFNRQPFVDMDNHTQTVYSHLVSLLAEELGKEPYSPVIIHYLSVLLIKANLLSCRQESLNWLEADRLRRLKGLIDIHFKEERRSLFYSGQLGLSSRKLNELSQRTMGKTVEELITDRLLSEMERFLGGSRMLMKEIVHELGFIDHSHFAYFFKRRKGLTPSAFRKQARKIVMPMHEMYLQNTV